MTTESKEHTIQAVLLGVTTKEENEKNCRRQTEDNCFCNINKITFEHLEHQATIQIVCWLM